MAIMTTGSIPKALTPVVKTFFGLSYNELPMQYTQIFEVGTMDRNFIEEVSVYGLSLATVRPEGSAISYDQMGQGFTQRYVAVTYGNGFILTRDAIEDNLYPQLAMQQTKQLAFSLRQLKENVHANVLNRAFSNSYVGADGVRLISTAHLKAKGGTFSNTLSVDADLSELAIEQMIINIMNAVNDAGLRINIMPKQLIIPPDLKFEAERILGSNLQYNTAENNINALKSMGSIPGGFIVNQYLSDTDAWFIQTNCPDGLKSYQRRPAMIDQDTDFDTDNVKYKATERYAVGWTDPRGIYGSQGA